MIEKLNKTTGTATTLARLISVVYSAIELVMQTSHQLSTTPSNIFDKKETTHYADASSDVTQLIKHRKKLSSWYQVGTILTEAKGKEVVRKGKEVPFSSH